MSNKSSILLMPLALLLLILSCEVAASVSVPDNGSGATGVATAAKPFFAQMGQCKRYRKMKVHGRWKWICVERAGTIETSGDGNASNAGVANTTDGLLAAAASHAPNWPNLDVLTNFPDSGKTCPLSGSANPSTNPEKACSNSLKNRYLLPTGGFGPVLLSDVMRLPLGASGGAPACNASNNRRAVSVIGYVREVKVGGCSFGESCNCGSQHDSQCDAHIELVLDPNDHDPKGRGMVVVEVTERSRRLAAKGLLQSNIGNDWSTQTLKGRLKGRWVRFSGWLYYDPDHHLESWQVDPHDNRSSSPGPHGQPKHDNWRSTCWEVHPVMGIEVNVPKPSDAVH